MQRDMEISDDETQKEDEVISSKHFRRKKRIDFVTSASKRFHQPPAGYDISISSLIQALQLAPQLTY
jgi:hypothetical protein